MTEWRKVHEHYEVSDTGLVRSLPRVDANGRSWPGQLLKPYRTGKGGGYLTVTIDGKHRKVHRLVAEAFLPPDAARPEVNHKQGDKDDNQAASLERCTTRENVRHAWEVLRRSPSGGHTGKRGALHHSSRPIEAVAPNGETAHFGSAAEAARQLGLQPASVIRTANGKYKHTGGYAFRWLA